MYRRHPIPENNNPIMRSQLSTVNGIHFEVDRTWDHKGMASFTLWGIRGSVRHRITPIGNETGIDKKGWATPLRLAKNSIIDWFEEYDRGEHRQEARSADPTGDPGSPGQAAALPGVAAERGDGPGDRG